MYATVTSLSAYSVVVLDTSAIEMLSWYIEYDVIGLVLKVGDHIRMVEQLVSGCERITKGEAGRARVIQSKGERIVVTQIANLLISEEFLK